MVILFLVKYFCSGFCVNVGCNLIWFIIGIIFVFVNKFFKWCWWKLEMLIVLVWLFV